ncbi:hypothetical protein MPPM_0779 [Methylorubrum populi]|uniref:Uncharacterized protein n=1 Tax=Methylorubrum populi TaxID=223967 RepID=A0A160PAZ1_9HYPH|nr:hypothetical protein [Methylorubrum populi]BAU89384.1 hypothetical protein MPPM_0779 [Methylorubrum populi]
MRIIVDIKFKFAGVEGLDRSKRSDSRSLFWQQASRRYDLDSSDPSSEGPAQFDNFVRRQENRIQSRFGGTLAELLRPHVGVGVPLIIKYRGIRYSSLNISLEVITAAFEKLGIKGEDLIDLIEIYAPVALRESVFIDNEDIETKVVGRIYEASVGVDRSLAVEPSTPPTKSRVERMWWISNMSLVLPAAMLLLASYLVYNSAQEERKQMNDALIKERVDIATQREKLHEKYMDVIKQLQEGMNAQSKQLELLRSEEKKAIEEKNKGMNTKPSTGSVP